MNAQKVSQYFFIIAAVISILDGSFTLDQTMGSVKLMLLLISGIIVGMLRHDKHEKEFVLAGLAVVFTGLIFIQLIGTFPLLSSFAIMLTNFIIFLSTVVLVVGIEMIGEIISLNPGEKPRRLKEESKNSVYLSQEDLQRQNFQRVWGTVILIAVALTFIILFLESFFDISKYQRLMTVLSGTITLLFLVDLIILYKDAKDFGSFLRNNIFDIIAAIPTVGILRSLKLFRAIKIVRLLKATKISKLTKIHKTTKFFSEESYFNKVNTKSATKKKVSAKKSTKSASKKKTSKKK